MGERTRWNLEREGASEKGRNEVHATLNDPNHKYSDDQGFGT